MIRDAIGVLAIGIFLIGIVITKVTGSSETGAGFVTGSYTILTKPMMWPVERQLNKLNKLSAPTTGTSTSK